MTKAQLKAKKIYLSNKELYCEILVSRAKGELTREAEKMLILLGKNIIRKFYYQNPDDRHDCLQTGYTQMFSNWYSFDPNKGSDAFAYFTEVFKRGVAQGWRTLYRTKGDEFAQVLNFSQIMTDDEKQYSRF